MQLLTHVANYSSKEEAYHQENKLSMYSPYSLQGELYIFISYLRIGILKTFCVC